MDQLGSDMLLDSDHDEKRAALNDDSDNVHIIPPDDTDSMTEDAETLVEPAAPTADDQEAMRNKFLPPSDDHEIEAEAHFTWDIENWRALPKRSHSPVFHCAGHPWRILFFPSGNSASESVSFYLEHGFEDEKPPEDWYACAQFMLVLHNPNDPSIYLHHEANHRFTGEEGDWGFTRFADKNRIFAAKFDGSDRPLVENDRAKMTAYVRVLKDPTGVLWHNFLNYDSKKETGLVGLRNQGATCYLNSLLQSLFLTGSFRKAVYQIPTATEEDRENSTSAYALQRLFYRLQADQNAVSTQELTHSFGWDNRQIFEQQDVQELSRILMEKLEARMKGTEAENALPNMFVGKMKTYLKCINVEYESSRIEDFWDLQLNVGGCKGVDDSFRNYIEVETLEGDNKYAAEGYGLQDAKKGVIFETFPDVLHLQLKRFEYDFQRDVMMKVNDRYEFPDVLDATPYLDESADRSESNIYHLHGVLVHSGDLNAGHYYAFLKPEKNGEFYRFDDDRVTRATKREAIDDNFGGDYSSGTNGALKGQNPYTRQWSTKRSNNAYMLVYIKESKLDQVLLPESELQPPQHLPVRIAEEKANTEKKRKEREEAHLYMNVQVASEASFRKHQSTDLIPWGTEDGDDAAAPKVCRLLKSMTMADFTAYIANEQGAEADLIRPWIMVNRQNGTVRPDHPLRWPDMTLQEAADKFSTRNSGFRVFMEETTRDESGQPIWMTEETITPTSPVVNGNVPQQHRPIIVFLKYFDIDRQELHGAGHIYMNPLDKAQDLAGPILKLMGWKEGVALELFEEIKQNYIEQMKPKNTLMAAEIQDGDIICFQKHLSESEVAAVQSSNPTACTNAPAYYDFLMNRMFVTLQPKPQAVQSVEFLKEDTEVFTIPLSKKDSYDAMAIKVADQLSTVTTTPVDPSHLRFTTVNVNSSRPRAIVKRQPGTTVANVLLGTAGYGGYGYAPTQACDVLYYEVLEMSLTDLEQRKSVKISWLSEGITKEEPYELLVHKQGTFEDVLKELQRRAELPDELLDHVRFYEAHGNKVFKLLPRSHSVLSINDFMTIFAERVPEDEEKEREVAQQAARDEKEESAMSDDEADKLGVRLVHCFHFEKEPSKSHGVPFLFLLKEGESFADARERLSRRTGLKGKQWEKVRLAVVRGGQSYSRPLWLEDDDIPFEKLASDDHLGLEHPNRTRSTWTRYESLNIR